MMSPKTNKNSFFQVAAVLIIFLIAVFAGWRVWLQRPDIAIIGMNGPAQAMFDQAARDSGIKARSLDFYAISENPAQAKLQDFKVILMSLHGVHISDEMRSALELAKAEGTKLIGVMDEKLKEISNVDLENKHADISVYLRKGGQENFHRLLAYLDISFVGGEGEIQSPVETPSRGFYHPDAPKIHTSYKDYAVWYGEKAGAPRIALVTFSGWKFGDTQGVDSVIHAFEKRGAAVFPLFGWKDRAKLIKEIKPDIVVVRGHGRLLGKGKAVELMQDLNVPLMQAVDIFGDAEEWQENDNALSGGMMAINVAIPELDGAIEPLGIYASKKNDKGYNMSVAIEDRVERLIDRSLAWIDLRRKNNSEKKVAIIYYKAPGKGDLSAAGLDVVPSLVNLLGRMKERGYSMTEIPDAAQLWEQIQSGGRNAGNWAAGALDKLIDSGDVLLLPAEEARPWFEVRVPQDKLAAMEESYGPYPGHTMTVRRDDKDFFVIPRIQFGNVMILPQPIRGEGKEGENLVHSETVPPSWQYVATYLWIKEKFAADALTHYGTHGTFEFLPGRPAIMRSTDWSDFLLADMPHVYVYTMDDVGEALTAKRRSYAVINSHLTPAIVKADAYGDIDKAHLILDRMKITEEGALKATYYQQLTEVLKTMRLDLDLDIDMNKELQEEDYLRAHDYLHELEDEKIAKGLHVHGELPKEEDLTAMLALMEGDQAEFRRRFEASTNEVNATLDALEGHYTLPSSGHDPIRNPDAIPTGRNLFGINPAEIPTTAAWETAQTLTDSFLHNWLSKHNDYPRKVGFNLWSTEVVRQHGILEAQIMQLLGVRPVWDPRGMVRDVEIVPEEELGRPRIDVVVLGSGQYRDAFPALIKHLDKAVGLVSESGFVGENTVKLEETMKAKGMAPKMARELATARIFGGAPGMFGTGLTGRIARSDSFEDEKELVDQYIQREGAVYHGERWGEYFDGLYEAALDGTEVVIHSRSSLTTAGPLSLDHVFEFMGGMTMAIRNISGVDPEGFFADTRDPNKVKMQGLQEALMMDARVMMLNPKWIAGMQQHEYAGGGNMAGIIGNLWGWQVTKPDVIDDHLWNETYTVYLQDKHQLGLTEWFDEHSPYALQDMTAIMLEAVRKGYWEASDEIVADLVKRHTDAIIKHDAACSVRTCANQKLRAFVAENLQDIPAKAETYAQKMRDISEATSSERAEGMVLKKQQELQKASESRTTFSLIALLLGLTVLILLVWGMRKKEPQLSV